MNNIVWSIVSPEKVFEYSYALDLFSPEECRKIIALGDVWEKSKLHGADDKTNQRNSFNKWVKVEGNEWIYRRIVDGLYSINNNIYQFKLYGFDELQLTKYEEGHYYNYHVDMEYDSNSNSTHRKLTASVILSAEEDYEGGDLTLNVNEEVIVKEKEQGTMIAFPSYRLHKVTPVTKGTRYSLVVWALGPSFV